MFTAKFYDVHGRRAIHEAESFSILAEGSTYEVTLFQAHGQSIRIDLNDGEPPPEFNMLRWYQRLVIENAAGKTTEMLTTPGAQGQPF